MSKYYKVEDVINTLADQWRFEQEMEYPDTAEDIESWKKVATELFADLPTIEVIVPTTEQSSMVGEWKRFKPNVWSRLNLYCSECGSITEVPLMDDKPIYDYCPSCGAKMSKDERIEE